MVSTDRPTAFQLSVGGQQLTFELGTLAPQASGAVLARYGGTLILATACASKTHRDIDFLPLTVDYEERLYAAGKIPGSFFRREGRPTQEAILTGRLIDRPLRPLFPKGLRNDVQVIVTVLSTDRENDPDILAIIAASTALGVSDIPFMGPISGSRIGCINGELVVNPTMPQLAYSTLDLVVAGTKDAVMMVEAACQDVPESLLMDAIKLGQDVNRQIIGVQEEIIAAHGKPKFAFTPAPEPEGLKAALDAALQGGKLEAAIKPDKIERDAALAALGSELTTRFAEQFPPKAIAAALEARVKAFVRQRVLHQGIRIDGRGPKEIRPITCQVGLLPRTHGSGLFQRGLTQVLSIVTLGSVGDKQKLDDLGIEEKKRFMHHYNMPPFSNGETGRIGSPGRREVGHGALAERALLPSIPLEEDFPYTIRIVSEVLSSNGSTSMASVCGSSLALMDAGVPVKSPVGGVAMGLMKDESGRSVVLTDIEGSEDAFGDMDFKVAGTAKGVNALQMDIKTKGITYQVMELALAQAKEGRLAIIEKMTQVIGAARSELSAYAPRMIRMSIPTEKIGAVIGPGGKTIRSIIEETKVSIDIEDDGTVIIGSTSGEAAQKAISRIEALTKEVEVGAVYSGKVTRIMTFGAFVEIMPGKEGLVHISELSDRRVATVEDVVKVGDELTVMVTEVDRMGRINLSRRAILEKDRPAGEREDIPGDGGRPPEPYRPSEPRDNGGPRRGPGGYGPGGQGGPPRGRPPYGGPDRRPRR